MALTLFPDVSTGVAMATETAEATDLSATQQELLQKVTSVLRGMQADTEAAAIYNVDFTQLSLGTQIPTYVVEQTGLVQSEIDYYPIFDGDGGLAFLVAATDAYGELYVQVTTELVDELNVYLDENDALALVYDQDGLYALSDTGSMVLAEYEIEKTNRGSILDMQTNMTYMSEENLPQLCVELLPLQTIEIGNNLITRSVAYSHYLSVPIIMQQNYDGTVNDYICWACTAASIGNYYTGRTDTGRYFATTMGMMDSFGAYEDILDILENRYFLNGFTKSVHANVPLSVGAVGSKLEASHPIGVLFSASYSTVGHWMVIRGYWGDNLMAYFSAMDPYSSTYTSGTLLDSFDRPGPPYYDEDSWSYIHVKDGSKMYLTSYFSK